MGYLTWYAAAGIDEMVVDVPSGTTILEAVRLAGLPYGEVAFAASGGEQRELTAPVREGERIMLIPPISGG